MSLPPVVNRERIDVFLSRLAQDYRQPARLYLVGGTSHVYERFRQQTLDVDVAFEVPADCRGELIQVLRKIRDTLGIEIEEVSPADYIPLPAGFEKRHQFIGRFGQVEVFHFDWYSTALSKIARGRQQDLADTVVALKNDRISLSKLEGMYRDILPLMGKKTLKQDPAEFALNFAALEALWQSAGGMH